MIADQKAIECKIEIHLRIIKPYWRVLLFRLSFWHVRKIWKCSPMVRASQNMLRLHRARCSATSEGVFVPHHRNESFRTFCLRNWYYSSAYGFHSANCLPICIRLRLPQLWICAFGENTTSRLHIIHLDIAVFGGEIANLGSMLVEDFRTRHIASWKDAQILGVLHARSGPTDIIHIA